MNWKNKTEEFFKWYIQDWAECTEKDITEKEVNELVERVMNDDYLFDTIDTELENLLNNVSNDGEV